MSACHGSLLQHDRADVTGKVAELPAIDAAVSGVGHIQTASEGHTPGAEPMG